MLYLIDGTRNQARTVRRSPEGDGEGGGERRGRLDRGEGLAADVVALGEAEDATDLIIGYEPGGRGGGDAAKGGL